MSLNAPSSTEVPAETARVARAVFPKGNRYLTLRDQLGPLITSSDFADLFSKEGRPAEDPARLALVTVLQFAERLSDQRAAEAVRSRIDWKYLLALPLEDTGFDASVLSEFRTRLVAGRAEHRLFEALLTHFREYGLLRARGRQRTDSTHVLAAVRALNRLQCVGMTLRHALNSLAVVVPDWLRAQSDPAWLERYGPRFDDYHLPVSQIERDTVATDVGADGLKLMTVLCADEAPRWLRDIPAVRTFWQVWLQNYTWQDEKTLRWRTNAEIPPAGRYISSPFDPEAHYSQKRTTSWVGYKVHLTESCDEDLPHLITDVQTTSATTADDAVTPHVQAALEQRDLLPAIQLADTGFVDAELIVESERRYAIDLLGPVRGDYHRQAKEGQGFAAQDFSINWDDQQATCPAGQTSLSWTPAIDRGHNAVIKIKFSRRDCLPCRHRSACTSAIRRTITIRPKEQHQALQRTRVRQQTPEFKAAYAERAGIEGTISQGTRSCGLRRTRYIGLAKTRLQHLASAAALNLQRVADWLNDEPQAQTRHSAYQRLYLPAT